MEISITIAELVIFLGGMLTVGLITSSNAKSIEKSKQASWESEKNELETSLNHLQNRL